MERSKAIKFLKTQHGIHFTKDILKAGISKRMMYQFRDEGVINQLSRGMYQYSEVIEDQYTSYIELTKRNPKAVFCLISSLDFHGIGTQIPYSQWVSLPRGIKRNNNCDYNIKVIHPTKEIYNLGIENHMVNNIGIKVYSLSKTVVDCFKHRNKIGLDVALEALKESIRLKKTTRKEIAEYAIKCKMMNIMMPYMESI
ncbi:hypothetical protein PQO01_06555 [Lentisphaera marina]|uniref:type IV toxin-antitoxin system AbiEi family antitoxin domain-containing protein n=1 Tax=Lentisphaera marina TaxID=1111041 RepID=UPI0023659E59|nr:hypothetical protein [Lentisphaera marina]MDD7984607.1 hypothetical protein [Lentisphaera marina]